jgi:D-alanyl-D-alanine carboxypeptidase
MVPPRLAPLPFVLLAPAWAIAQSPEPKAPPAEAAIERQAPDLPALEAAVAQHLAALQAERGFPGCGAGFVLPDGRAGAAVVGHEDLEKKRPLTLQHTFLSGSIGKTYCAAMALQLVGEGKLSLDAKVADVLGKQDWFARLPNAAEITLRQLMTHTSGIPDHVWKKDFQAKLLADPDRAMTPVECVSFVLGDAPLCAPGEKWAYADTNFVLVGLMIEAATGKPFYEVLRQRALEPLGLQDTLPSDRRDLRGLANGHASGLAIHEGDTVVDGRYFVNPVFEYCGGGICSTPKDLARWGHLLFAGDVVPEALRAEQRSGVPAPQRVTEAYGLGCFVMRSKHGPALGHSGFMPGYRAMLAHYVDLKLTVALMWNTDDGQQVGNERRAAADLAGVLQERLAAPANPGAK